MCTLFSFKKKSPQQREDSKEKEGGIGTVKKKEKEEHGRKDWQVY